MVTKDPQERRLGGEQISPAAQERVMAIYNRLVEMILDLYKIKEQGGFLKKNVLDEPMKNLYRSKDQLWRLAQRYPKKPKKKKKYSEMENLFYPWWHSH